MSLVRRVSAIATLAALLGAPAGAMDPPPAGVYAFNHDASVVGFTLYAWAIFKMKRQGRFDKFSGELAYDPAQPGATHVDLTVYTASVDMNNQEHDALLRSPEFFDAARFPTMRFVSESAAFRQDGTFTLTGELTIRGVTKRITIPVTLGRGGRADASPRFETTFEIDRTEYGLNGVPTWGGIDVSIAKNVQIHIAIATAPLRPRQEP